MKSRSSTGVGMKVDLDYNIDTMRISDSGVEETARSPGSSIMEQIKTKSNMSSPHVDTSTGEISSDSTAPRAEMGSNKLKNMLANIKQRQV
jgi:hypothetical protein